MIKLGILEVGKNLPDLVPEHGTYAEWFIPLLSQASRDIDFRIFEAYKDELPSGVESCQAYLITGSASSVYGDEPWLEGLGRFVMDAARSVPIVGICFGHQLLHQLYGGTVEKSEKGWGIGIHDYPVHERRSWMTPAANALSLVASHSDQVTRPAPNSRTLASSTFCPIAMSEFGDNVMSIQPHPEMTRALANEVFEMRRDEQGHDVTDAAMASMNNPIDDGVAAYWIVRFLEERVK